MRNSKKTRQAAGAVFAALVAGMTAVAANAQMPAPLSPSTGITVQGSGEVQVRPDIARVNLGVQTQNIDPQKASQENSRATDALIKAVRGLGVAEKDIQTSGYNISPQYVYRPPQDQDKPPLIAGYYVSNTVLVTVRKISDTGRVIDAAVKAGANVAGGVAFDLNDADKVKAQDEALTRAVADATRKAQVIARAAQAGGIFLASITEGGEGYVRPQFQSMAMGRAKADVSTPVAPGEQTISANVTVRYTFNQASKANY